MPHSKQAEFITIEEARRLIFPGGKPIGPATIWRWILRGCGPQRIRLKSWKIGGRRFTSEAAVEEFIAALNPEITPAEAPAARRRRAARAAKEAEEALA